MNSKAIRQLVLGSVLVLLGASSSFAQGYVHVKAAPSGPDVKTTSTTFVDIPDMTLYFFQYYPGNVCISMSAESYVTGNKRMFVRALVDGQPASPSDIVFSNDGFAGTHSFHFTATVGGGLHQVTMQYLVDSGGEAHLGDRTMWVTTAPDVVNTIAAPSGPSVSTTSSSFVDIPNMVYNIQIPEPGDVVITLTGEAYTSNYKRMFVRALLDGQPASPGDVVFAVGPYTGTHAFSFVAKGVQAGAHTVQLQWGVDGGGTAYMGDRTFTIGYSNSVALAEGKGGVLSLSAPSGSQITTTSSSFSTIPDLSTIIFVPENGTLVISMTAEAYSSSGKRMFVRALVDGQPTQPADVVFTGNNFIGTCSFNFVRKNLRGGSHQVALQWLVDSGGTAYMGDRNMTLIAFPAPAPDMAEPFNQVKPVTGDRPLLVICWDPHRPAHPAPSISDVQSTIFGGYPSVRDYFIVNSHNRFFVNDVGIKGWYAADKPADHYWNHPASPCSDGFIHGHIEKWAEAIRKADQTFNFAQYDANGNGTLEPDELGIMIVIPQNTPFGTNRVPLGREYPTAEPLVVDNVKIPMIAEAYIGAPPNLGLVAHELSHLLLNLPDMYFNFFFPYAAGMYSLMDVGYYDNHLDPFLKIRLGWIQPAIVRESGYVPIEAVEISHIAYILHDPSYSNREYFIVENRYPGLAYDSSLPDSGLAVWHIMEEPNVYQNLSAPPGVDPNNWATIGAGDWGRRAIRMIRPVYGPPFDNSLALWDGSDPQTGYDLLSDDPDPTHATLKWHDGTPSGFAIKDISPAGGYMRALIEVPGMPVSVEDKDGLASNKPTRFWLEQNYPNPFNPRTSIPFYLEENSPVTIKILNVLGQEVTTLLDQKLSAGKHVIEWNGMDKNGTSVPSGVYFYQVKTRSTTAVKKMILMR